MGAQPGVIQIHRRHHPGAGRLLGGGRQAYIDGYHRGAAGPKGALRNIRGAGLQRRGHRDGDQLCQNATSVRQPEQWMQYCCHHQHPGWPGVFGGDIQACGLRLRQGTGRLSSHGTHLGEVQDKGMAVTPPPGGWNKGGQIIQTVLCIHHVYP